jgi:hypothetical protein
MTSVFVPSLRRKAASQGRIGKIMDSKIIDLGHEQPADRMVWVAVLSESDSAPSVAEKWARRGR